MSYQLQHQLHEKSIIHLNEVFEAKTIISFVIITYGLPTDIMHLSMIGRIPPNKTSLNLYLITNAFGDPESIAYSSLE